MRIAGVILAGGEGRRMGGADKALIRLGGAPLLARVAARFGPQVDALALSANGPPRAYAAAGMPVLADTRPGGQGPLAGVLAGLDWAADAGADLLATVAVDTPFLPQDLVARLAEARARADAAVAFAESGGRRHPTAALWRVDLRSPLRTALAAGTRRMEAFVGARGAVPVTFAIGAVDPFFNVNTPDDLASAERYLAENAR
ncbi:molybdenum cofactor guanylyltransferase [Rhodovulum sp. ES.010]|uniref:molybdenum cofactor guanylyltransferase MobA n=1 Tax=Rhodovulum sp. ES.010 TaxID=1882821 RepID=UPI0009259404|nr:molybdenum cofactor guanylyltransferase MobA [Rhodovulum sp. ES.010]SIO46717.1 molybdenum cofactor guanylyltransferase [Rhodovulum sp. ES.010]